MKQNAPIDLVRVGYAAMSALTPHPSNDFGIANQVPVLEPRRPLPDVCARHGRPAREHRTEDVRFHQAGGRHVQSSFAANWIATIVNFGSPPSTTTRIRLEWPLCGWCLRRARLLRCFSGAVAVSGLLGVVGLWMASQAGVAADTLATCALAIIPGWFPGGLMVAGYLFSRSGPAVRFRPLSDPGTAVIRAHPDFAAAVRAG